LQETSLLIGTKSNRGAQWGYRPSIDGLRAIAVLSVIVFHFNKTTMSGGFIGVDVFFVISGYLLTSILLIDIDKKQFSISRFYQRRIARIFRRFLSSSRWP
jgi:peptidoglycan/LPS O-acetylase OafA/YrhL